MTLRFDHIAISARSLDEGVAHVEQALGVALAGGGQHAHMATHNRLLGLGDLYLEVIAANPAAPRPAWPRWFDLDSFIGPPRLTNWIAATDDMAADLAVAPPSSGTAVELARGNYRWQMAIPADGRLPFEGAFPALIQWHGSLHPAATLPETGVRLTLLEIAHPEAAALRAALTLHDPRVQITQGPAKAMRAEFTTPHGTREIG